MDLTVGKRGKNFTINGQKRLLHMATSFGWLGLIRQNRIDDAKQWLDRMNFLGMDGIRCFGEYGGWQDNWFFSRVAPLWDVWPNPERAGGSWLQVSKTNAKVLRKAIKLLKSAGLIMEYVTVATLKSGNGRTREVTISYMEHMNRAIAQWMKEYEDSEGATNCLYETVNEADVAWPHLLTAHEHGEIFRRFHTRDFPGSLISVSNGGGSHTPTYPVGGTGATHINIHPDRGKYWRDWVSGGGVKSLIDRYKVPVYLNETNHYMSGAEWAEFTPQVPKWKGISTRDHAGLIEQADEVFNQGGSFCLHYLTGMLSEPDRPLVKVERMWKEAFGPSPAPEPPPVLPPAPGTPELGFWGKVWDFLKGLF